MRTLLYRAMARLYPPERESRALHRLARTAECVLRKATVSVGGVKVNLGPTDLLDRFLLLGRNLNPFFVSACKQYIGRGGGGIAVDAGANAGILSVLAAREPGCEVLAFEPSPRELSRFYDNVQTSGLAARVAIFPVALTDRCGRRQMFISAGPNWGMNSLLSVAGKSSSVEVRTARFDALFSPALLERVRVVKVDVEGAEMELLQGMTGAFEHLQRAVFVVEVSPTLLAKAGSTASGLYEFFQSHGFQPTYGQGKEFQWEEVFLNPKMNAPLEFTAAL